MKRPVVDHFKRNESIETGVNRGSSQMDHHSKAGERTAAFYSSGES